MAAALLSISSVSSVEAQLEGLHCDADIVLMLDRTGSMSASDRTAERDAAKAFLDLFATAATPPLISIGAFGDGTNGSPEAFIDEPLSRTQSPAPYGDDDGSNDGDLYDGVDDVTASASSVGTNLHDALEIAGGELTANGETSQRSIVLISDGDPSEPGAVAAAREATYDESDALKLAGVNIFTIHFGADPSGFAGHELLAAVASGSTAPPATDSHNGHGHQTGSSDNQATAAAENTDGDNFFRATSSTDFEPILEQIAEQYCVSLPTATPTHTHTHTNTPTATHTNTSVPTATHTNTSIPTATHTHTSVPTATHTHTHTHTNTPTATNTHTHTHTNTPTATNTHTHTHTNTPTVTNTFTNTPTSTATATDTATATATATDTHTNTPTHTATHTHTWTFTATATNTDTPVPTATHTNTPLPTSTNTATAVPTATDTATPLPTDTATATATATMVPDLCGDGAVDPGEACDDGNAFNGDGCENNCTISSLCNFAHAGPANEVFVNDNIFNDGGAPLGCTLALFTSIQDAIDAITTGDGDIIRVCPGAYAESVVVDKEVAIRSTGGEAVTSITSAGIAFDVRRSAVTIEGFTIEAAATAISASSICQIGQTSCSPARGSNLTVRDNTIQNSPQGVTWTSRVDCALIELNEMSDNASHIDIDQQSGAPAVLTRISQNQITGGGSSGHAVSVSGIGPFTLIVGNLIDGSAGNGLVLASMPSGGLVEENNINNSANSGILVLPGAASVRIRQNNIVGNGVGLTNQAPEGTLNATLNWWGSQTGPFHAIDRPSGVGDEVIEIGGLDTTFIEFLCAPAPGGFPSENGECGGAEPEEELNFVAFGREPDVSPNGRFISFVSDHDLNRDAIVTADNSDGGDEIFLINRAPGGKPDSFCLGGTTPGADCKRTRDCPADFDADPIVNEGVCVLLTQLTNEPTGTGQSFVPRVTRNGNVFFATTADTFGTNGDGSIEVHTWSRRGFRREKPADPNDVVAQLSDAPAGQDSNRPGSDRGGRRRVFMQSNSDPLGTNGDGNTEIMLLDIKKNQWTQVTDSTGADSLRPATQNGRQVIFDSAADLTGDNPDGNREIFYARFKRGGWVISQITDTAIIENRAGSVSKRGKILTFSSNGNYVGQNADGNREVFVWEAGVIEQITHTTAGENANPQANPRGRFVTFESTADAEDGGTGAILTNRRVHLFDRKKGTTLLLSRSFFGDNTVPRISQGRFIVWESTANLTGQNPDGEKAIYLFDRRKDD